MVKITELTKTVSLAKADAYGAGTTYNGAADATGIGTDISGYNEALVIFDAGTATGTANLSIVNGDDLTAAPSTWDAVTGAAFDEVDSDNDETVYVARLDTKALDGKYIAVKAVVATDAVDFGVSAVLTGSKELPEYDASNVVFDV